MTTVVSILLSDVVALRERGTFQGYINIVYAAGAGLGAPLGLSLSSFMFPLTNIQIQVVSLRIQSGGNGRYYDLEFAEVY